MSSSPRWLAALVASGLALQAAAQSSPTVEERLQALERQVHDLSQENAALKKDLGWKDGALPVEVRPGGAEDRIAIGGFLQAQAEFGHATDNRFAGVKDRFYFRRARVYVAGTVAKDFDFKAEIDLQGNTLSAQPAGLTARANEVYVYWHRYPAVNLRFGQLKPAFGAEALSSDGKLYTAERSLSSDRLADGRQLAMGVTGDLLGKQLNYSAVVANGNGANTSANDNSHFQRSLRFAYTPVSTANDKLVLGMDGLWSTDSSLAKPDIDLGGYAFTGERFMHGWDFDWTHGRFDVNAEWLHGQFKPTNHLPAAEVDAAGWQATVAYFLIPSRLQAVLREEQFDPNTAIGGNTAKTFTYGLNIFLKGDDLKFMVNYLDGHLPGSATDGGRLITRLQIVY